MSMSRHPLPHSLSEATSNVVCRIPELLRRLRDLENEEAELDAKARQLVEQPPKTEPNDKSSTPSRPTLSTPVSKRGSRATDSTVDEGVPSTPHIDPSI